MPLILAIESDRRQAARISSLARERLNVELLVAESAERALQILAERTPDLILTPQLMSPKDEAALDQRLRELDTAGSHVQTLMIPVLASTGRRGGKRDGGLLNRLRRGKNDGASEGGCDPGEFAAQIAEYLQRAADDRAAQAVIAEDQRLIAEDHRSIAEDQRSIAKNQHSIAEDQHSIVEDQRPIAKDQHSIVEDQRAYHPSVLREVPQPASDVVEPAVSQFRQELAQEEFPGTPVAAVVSDAGDAFEVEESAFDELSTILSRSDIEEAPMLAARRPTEAQPDADIHKPVPAAFEDFVEFEELSIVDAPSVAFGELTAVVQRIEAEAAEALEASDALDALEILTEPEIPAEFDVQPEVRQEPPQRPALAVSRHIPDEPEPDPRTSHFDFEGDLWMPLPVAAHRRWPALQGPTVKAILTPAFDAPPDPDVEFAPPPDPTERTWGKKRSKSGKPYQDEWGFFDPVQCGFAALLAKLDEVTDKDEVPSK